MLSVDFGDGRPIERGFLIGGIGVLPGHATGAARHSLPGRQADPLRRSSASPGPVAEDSDVRTRPALRLSWREHRSRPSMASRSGATAFMFLGSTLNAVLPGVAPFWGEGPGRLAADHHRSHRRRGSPGGLRGLCAASPRPGWRRPVISAAAWKGWSLKCTRR